MKKVIYISVIFYISINICSGLTKIDNAIEYYKSKSGIVLLEKSDVSDVLLTNIKSIMDDDVKFLVIFDSLKVLSLEGTNITSKGLIYIKDMKKLEGLFLKNTKVDDSGMKYLKALESLQDLDLVNTKVTDEGIQELSGLENLRMLKLRGTKVTQKGIDKLQKKLPDCYITLETDEEIQ